MSFRDTVMFTAWNELSNNVCWRDDEDRILDYFRVSTGLQLTKAAALEVSWCSYFVHWCLFRGGMSPLPRVGTAGTLGKVGGSVGRFMKSHGGIYNDHLVNKRDYAPRPGDMYNRPVPNNHIGFIADVRAAGKGRYEIMSIDGNSGPPGFSPLFDMSNGRKIGYGFIYQPPQWRQLTPDCYYIELCEDD